MRGGDVKDGDYVYGFLINRTGNLEILEMVQPIVFRYLDGALEHAAVIGQKYIDPGHTVHVLVSDPKDVVFDEGDDSSQSIIRADNDRGRDMQYLNIFIYRYKLSEKRSIKMERTGQRRTLGQVGNKTGLPPVVEGKIADLLGVRGY